MRYLVNNLFGEYGLVILDANDYDLKEKFVPIIQSELVEQKTNQLVNATTEVLKNYTIQVNPREINLFYLKNNLRERIILENEIYKINNTDIIFTKEEIIAQTENFPERFSPNVILRPLYQEVILPNLAYIGGGGEIAYWLELKSVFDYYNTTFPMLIVRNSVVITTEKLEKKRNKLQLSWSNLFQNQVNLVNLKMQELSKFPLNFDTQKTHLKNQFSELLKIAEQTDKSFLGAVLAQQSKQIKGLENLEKRLLKAEKKAHKLKLEQVTDLQNRLFPNQELQERQLNFAEFYLEYGSKLIPLLIEKLIPLDTSFEIIVLP
jgi:bacillithiol biosynthesis cysteine-adding enzyme BshC